ncbi:hypothetical protein CBOM_05727 [Ceraceosorus bombacis]|uniref:Uncharacterized protein n=1 Tax=Ceraceosorus bombacis TaxID=401625 RepID=A0A0P1BQ65_9BASI|nr:hypothetical protein CBOM_05727 [Ceraceosorus bombacis]
MEELERFLRETDPDWPGDDDEEALGADVRTTPRPSSSTFDDDFDDFLRRLRIRAHARKRCKISTRRCDVCAKRPSG